MGIALKTLLLGLLATTSPCILPLYPGFLAYLSSQTEPRVSRQNYFLGFFVLAGVLSMMIVMGGLISALSVSIGHVLAYTIPLADLVLLSLGVLILLDRNPFKILPQIQVPLLRHPFLNAYVYGLLYGPITLPCSGPLAVSVFALSLTIGDAFSQLWVFVWFGIGFGLPLLILSLLSGGLQRQLALLVARQGRLINVISGLFLVAIAIYDITLNWRMVLLFFS